MFVTTPILDPVEVETVFTADDTTDTLTAIGHGLIAGTKVFLRVGTEDGAAPPGGLQYPWPFYVVSPAADTFQLASEPNGTPIDITSVGVGTHTAVSYAPVDVEVRNIDQNGALVPGETVTVTDAFTPVRPDLLLEADLTRLVRTLIQELRRQVIANVDMTTNTDFDSLTGDGLDIAELSAIPGLVLSGPDLRLNRFYSENQLRPVGRPELGAVFFADQRPAYTVDLVFTLIGVTDSKVQAVNLQAECHRFFQRNKHLRMRRDGNDQSSEFLQWEMEIEPGGDFSAFGQTNSSNIRSFSGTFTVRGFDIDDPDMATTITRLLEDQQADGSIATPSPVILDITQIGVSYPIGPSPTDTR
jgi:hypothetical protein